MCSIQFTNNAKYAIHCKFHGFSRNAFNDFCQTYSKQQFDKWTCIIISSFPDKFIILKSDMRSAGKPFLTSILRMFIKLKPLLASAVSTSELRSLVNDMGNILAESDSGFKGWDVSLPFFVYSQRNSC